MGTAYRPSHEQFKPVPFGLRPGRESALKERHASSCFVTEDNGRTWRPFGADRDKQSPYEVDTRREGVFGFRLLIHNQSGQSARQPQPGERADTTVVVDMSPPRVRLLEAKFVEGKTRAVDIRWHAVDTYLGKSPVQLSFAPRANGPWSVVVSDLENTGRYTWIPANPLPAQVYLRVEVRDKANNLGTDQSLEPVGGAARHRPQGIIRSVRPIQ